MKHQVLLSVLATLVATTSTLFAQPGTGEDGPPLDPVPSQPIEPVGPTAPPPPQLAVTDPEPEPASTVATGIAVEIRIDTTQVLVDNDVALPGMAGGIFVGHRSRALTIGVGFDMTRLSESGGSGSSGQSLTSFLIIPGVRFVLARTADTRTELLGQVDAGYGQSIRGSDNTMGAPDRPNIHRLRFQAGPSLRHWLSPSFAVGGTAGLRYDRQSVSTDDGMGGTASASFAITAVFASLQMTAVF